MQLNSLKFKIKKGELTIGSWLTIPNIIIAEIMASRGFDWLVVDMEHSSIVISEAQKIIQTIQAKGIAALVRVGENSDYQIKRALDAGADGIIVPMIKNRKDVIKMINSTYYPPKGKRGVGLSRAQGYGFDFLNYKNRLKDEIIIIAQIEHIDSVLNLDEILSFDDLDATLIGPYDLSASIGYPGDFKNKQFLTAINEYENKCSLFEKTRGAHIVHPNKENIKYHIENDYNFIALSLDTILLGESCDRVLNNISKMKES